jgi:hypothetical protein
MGKMTIGRVNMNNQITKPPMKKKNPYGMKYGGKTKGMKHGGSCRGMGSATQGGKFTVS